MKLGQIKALSFLKKAFSEINQGLMEECEATVFQVLKSAAKCDQTKLSKTASFKELGFDSLDQVELIVAMEENFGVNISNEEAEKISVVSDAILTFYRHWAERISKEKQENDSDKK